MTNQDKTMREQFDAWARKWSYGVLNSDDDAGRVSRLGAWAAWQAATAAAMSMKPESIDTSAERVDVGEPVAWGWRDTMIGKGHRLMMVRLGDYNDGVAIPLFTAYQLAAAVAAERERYRAALDQVKHLTNIVRMPNAEYVADEHNAAVNALREIRDAIRSGK